MLAARDCDSDSSGTRRDKKQRRAQARREARQSRERLKDEDPFLYYFGKADPDKVKAVVKTIDEDAEMEQQQANGGSKKKAIDLHSEHVALSRLNSMPSSGVITPR